MRIVPHAVVAVLLLFAGGTRAFAIMTQTFVPTAINYPGATSTQARGINNPGEVVGTYTCSASCTNPITGEVSTPGVSHGFLLEHGLYTRIDVPGASQTIPRGIGEQGIIVGQYTAGGVTHGFTYRDGTFTYPIDVPAALFDNISSPRHTLAVGISPQGELVGCYHEDNMTMTTMHGWLWRNGEFIELVTPHSPGDRSHHDPDTMNNAISATGEIVGFYFSEGVSYIADEGGIVTKFTVAGDLFTLAWGVNARGDVVGVHGTNQAGTVGSPVNPRGFLRTRDGNYVSLAVQGASSTQIFAINGIGDIVGAYTDGMGTHGFVSHIERSKQ
jgi:uncharacterized membrane protein